MRDGQTVGLGSGRAAAALAAELGRRARGGLSVRCVPTSLQIKAAAEKEGLPLAGPDETDRIDAAFDGADQIDARGRLVKGGGGALLRERIIFEMADRVSVIADASKFVRVLCMPVPVEVHPAARALAARRIAEAGGSPSLRTLARGYPFFTENGNLVFDCDFGQIPEPGRLARRIARCGGVMGVGLFADRKPDAVYRARGKSFETVRI